MNNHNTNIRSEISNSDKIATSLMKENSISNPKENFDNNQINPRLTHIMEIVDQIERQIEEESLSQRHSWDATPKQ